MSHGYSITVHHPGRTVPDPPTVCPACGATSGDSWLCDPRVCPMDHPRRTRPTPPKTEDH